MSKLDIINRSLRRCALNTIGSIDDDLEEARVVSEFYDSAIQEIVESYSWSFLINETELNKIDTGTKMALHDYQYGFSLPSDFYRAKTVFAFNHHIYNNTKNITGASSGFYLFYTIRGENIYSNISIAKLVYYKNIISDAFLTTLPMKFKNCITSKLALLLSHSQNPSISKDLQEEYEMNLYSAKNFDSQLKKVNGFDNRDHYFIELKQI